MSCCSVAPNEYVIMSYRCHQELQLLHVCFVCFEDSVQSESDSVARPKPNIVPQTRSENWKIFKPRAYYRTQHARGHIVSTVPHCRSLLFSLKRRRVHRIFRQIDDFDLMAGHFLSYVQVSIKQATARPADGCAARAPRDAFRTDAKAGAGNASAEGCRRSDDDSVPLRPGRPGRCEDRVRRVGTAPDTESPRCLGIGKMRINTWCLGRFEGTVMGPRCLQEECWGDLQVERVSRPQQRLQKVHPLLGTLRLQSRTMFTTVLLFFCRALHA